MPPMSWSLPLHQTSTSYICSCSGRLSSTSLLASKQYSQSLHEHVCARAERQAVYRAIRAQHTSAAVHEDLLQDLLPLEDSQLRSWLPQNAHRVSLDFLLWLADREGTAVNRDKWQLGELGRKLTALREGLDPLAAAALLAPMNPTDSPPSLAIDNVSLQLEVQQRQQQLVRRQAQEIFSPAQLQRTHKQVEDLTQELADRQAASVTELIGRAPADLKQAEQGINAAAASERILAVLLSIPDREQRLAMVPDAFIPLDSAAQGPAEQEMIYTSPMRLLQAVGLAMSRLDQGSELYADQLLLQGPIAMSTAELKVALSELKTVIFECWERPGMS